MKFSIHNKKCNPSKPNRLVESFQIESLQERNKALLKILSELGFKDKHTEELQLAIVKDIVKKYWIGSKE